MSDHGHPVDPERVDAVRARGPPADDAEAMAGLLTLLADPLRSRILAALVVADEVCVGDLALALDASEDAVSYAPRLRRTAGRMGYYRLRDGEARDALEASLSQLRQLAALHPETSADDADTEG